MTIVAKIVSARCLPVTPGMAAPSRLNEQRLGNRHLLSRKEYI